MNPENYKKKLTIITPYYNTLTYTINLANVLLPQLRGDIEWLIVDDGCHEHALDRLYDVVYYDKRAINDINIRVIHLDEPSGNASHPRNVGLDNATGEYIVFVDSDDLVTNDYIYKIRKKIYNEDFDYCYFSWASRDMRTETDYVAKYIIEDEPCEWNRSVWDCIYKRSLIGDERFNIEMLLGEDGDFNDRVRKGKKSNILDILYLYNWKREGSISDGF